MITAMIRKGLLIIVVIIVVIYLILSRQKIPHPFLLKYYAKCRLKYKKRYKSAGIRLVSKIELTNRSGFKSIIFQLLVQNKT